MRQAISVVLSAAAAEPLWKRRLMLLAMLVFFGGLALAVLPLLGLMLLGPARYDSALFKSAIAMDQFANAVTRGDEDETISSRTGKAIYLAYQRGSRAAPMYRLIRWFTDLVEPEHVFIWIETDRGILFTDEQKEEALKLVQQQQL